MAKRAVVVGLGTVGIPLALKVAEAGVRVTGLEHDARKVEALNRGEYPLPGKEPGIAELLQSVRKTGRFEATADPEKARGADFYLLCVETPFDHQRHEPDTAALRGAAEAIAPRIGHGSVVVVESTVAPLTTENVVKPILEKGSGLRCGKDFLLGHCPERVTPGKLLHNMVNVGRVVGGVDAEATRRMIEFYQLFVKAELVPSDARTAEVVKTTENAYRDVEIAFANEVAKACEVLGVDAFTVRDLVNKVPFRNMHSPGVGVGGHCLPKDPLLLAHSVRGHVDAKVLLTARAVNDSMPAHTAKLVEQALKDAGGKMEGAKVVLLGASYLANTSDTRNTPSEPLAEALEARNAMVVLTDPFARELGHRRIEEDAKKALEGADAAVLVTNHDAYRDLDLAWMKSAMRRAVIVDGRGFFDAARVRAAGFVYKGVGRA